MKLAIGVMGTLLVFVQFGNAQTKDAVKSAGEIAAVVEADNDSYAVFGATPSQEAALREQIRVVHPDVSPLRVFLFRLVPVRTLPVSRPIRS